MKSIKLLLGLILSVLLFTGAYLLLPKVKVLDSRAAAGLAEESFLAFDTLTLPQLGDAVFERVTSKRLVAVGDTLGYLLKDSYLNLRDSLEAFAKTGLPPKEISAYPKVIQSELAKFLGATNPKAEPKRSKTRYVLRGNERDYLMSDIMGAEDASTELIRKINRLSADPDENAQTLKDLKAELSKKQAFIAAAKAKLSKTELISTSISAANPVAPTPRLTASQRARILSLSETLPIDTQRVFAPIAGRYYRPDEGIGYIIAEANLQHKNQTFSDSVSGTDTYTLKAQGEPVLWGTAVRNDSSSNLSAKKSLRIVVQ